MERLYSSTLTRPEQHPAAQTTTPRAMKSMRKKSPQFSAVLLEHEQAADAREDERETGDERSRELPAGCRAVLVGVEVLNGGAFERRVLHARGHEQRKAREDAHEHDDHEEAVASVPGRQLDRALEEQAERDAQEDERHAGGHLERQHAPVVVIAADVGGRASGDGAAVAGAARLVRSPVTSSSSVQSNISHILSSLSISGWLFSDSHFVTDCLDTPSSMASCSWVMLRSARRCWRLSRKAHGLPFVGGVRCLSAPLVCGSARRNSTNQRCAIWPVLRQPEGARWLRAAGRGAYRHII